jgi:hypothetical protein
MQRAIILGAQGGATVTIDGNVYQTVRTSSSGLLIVARYSGTSASAAGTVTTPAGGAAIVTSGALTVGTYEVQVLVGYGGVADVFNNMQLQVGATVIGRLYAVATVNSAPTVQLFTLSVPAATAVTVNAVAAGAAGSIYEAVIIWTQVQ